MNTTDLKRFFAFAAAITITTLVTFTLYSARNVILIALIGIGAGVLISPVMTLLLERFRIPRIVSAVLLVLTVLGICFCALYGIYSLASDQLEALIQRSPAILNTAQERFASVIEGSPWIRERLEQFNVGKSVQTVFGTLFAGLQNTLGALSGGIIILIMALYTALNSSRYLRGFLSLFPEYMRPRAQEVLHASASVLRNWFKAQLTVMSITGMATTLGLWLLGIEFWIVLGLLTTVFSVIPFVGAFLTGGLTVLVTLGSEPEKVWWVLALYVGIQQIEANITAPLVMRGGVQLPELHLVILMLIMGQLFGLIGIFVAPPLFTVARCIYLMVYVPRMNAAKRPARQDKWVPAT